MKKSPAKLFFSALLLMACIMCDKSHTYMLNRERTIKLNNKYLNIPVKQRTTAQLMQIFIDKRLEREFVVELDVFELKSAWE